MSPNLNRTTKSESHIRRRRHAAPGNPNWVRRAGIVGGVVSALALSGAAAPAMADHSNHTPAPVGTATTAEQTPALSTTASAAQAAAAIDQTVVQLKLQAAEDAAAAAARKAAAATKRAELKKAADAKAAAAKAADEREAATQAASRSSERTKLSVSSSSSSSSSKVSSTASKASGSIASVISFLQAQVGKAYVMGGTGPSSYDCSGLVQAAFRTIGVDLPRTSQEQSNTGTPVSISSLQVGDLVFWGGQGSAYHVGVYIGGDQYLDAANPSTGIGVHDMSWSMPDFATRVV
ncbi:C40 family peptidase [Streptomyces sp. SID13666]|uniref:C40 family peptidase n=1 Tax=Streptomyces TaxID=1883 RepID=UPI0011070403|nr:MULTISPECIES: C40 family peptidase [Streptomyces]MCZ4097025.1 C40 family peptidase [Streptomyces sp. H39-C1]NEA56964.1 C40 family peptidase [Streptomyces sp. SID13666]NEA74878.1 C40 family peptidase [Streptomyces sp. SID13588]QNA74733.1 C40 family peptidase [Streptomyces sp. So13.3]